MWYTISYVMIERKSVVSQYALPLQSAIMFFPVLAAVFTIPYIIHQYHKYGAVLALRVIIVYSFILYLTCAYLLTILPLPTIAEVAADTSPTMDLVPFHMVTRFLEDTSFVAGDPSTWLPALREPCFYEPFFNVLLLLPLGIYLRYYFRRGFVGTVAIAFLVSLSFELLQLSALFGLYPRPYRLFQTDDLIANTFGAVIGYVLTPMVSFFLPSRERMDAVSYKRGQEVSLVRRGVGCAVDWVIIALVLRGLSLVTPVPTLRQLLYLPTQGQVVFYCLLVALYFVVLPFIFGGRTLGRAVVKVQVVTQKRNRPSLLQLIIRDGIKNLLVLPAPFMALNAFYSGFSGIRLGMTVILAILFMVLFIYTIGQLLIGFLTGNSRLFYERLSHTQCISTIRKRG